MSPEIIVFSLNSMEKMDWEDVLIEMGGVRGMGGSPCEKGITILCLLPSVVGTQGFILKVPSASNGHKDFLSSKSSSPSSLASHAPVACPGCLLFENCWLATHVLCDLSHSLNTLSLSFLPHGAAVKIK